MSDRFVCDVLVLLCQAPDLSRARKLRGSSFRSSEQLSAITNFQAASHVFAMENEIQMACAESLEGPP